MKKYHATIRNLTNKDIRAINKTYLITDKQKEKSGFYSIIIELPDVPQHHERKDND